jgi:universal stress protein F
MFRTILVPVDVSDLGTAEPAIDKAVELAQVSGGAIRLIHVRSIVPVTFMEFVPPQFDAEQQSQAEASLTAVAERVPLSKERVSTTVTMGSVYHDVLAEADRIKADLIVVGSHRPTMATYLLGSNAATIVRHARCSVLVVR